MATFKLDFNNKPKDNIQDLVAQLIGLPNSTSDNNKVDYKSGPTKLNALLENRDYLDTPANFPKVNMQQAIQNLVNANNSQAPTTPVLPQQGPTIANAANFVPKQDTFLDQVNDPYSSINQLYPKPSETQDPGKGIDEALKKGDWGAVLGNTLKYLSSSQGTPILGAFTNNPYQKGAYSDIAKEKLANENLTKENINKKLSDRSKALLDLSQQYATRDFERKKQKIDQDFKEKEFGLKLGELGENRKSREQMHQDTLSTTKFIAGQNAQDKKEEKEQKKKEKLDSEKSAALEPFDKLSSMLDGIESNIGAGIPVDEKGIPKELSGPEYYLTLAKLKTQASNPTLQSPEQKQLATDLPLIADVVNRSFGGGRAMAGIKNALKALSDPTDPSIKNRRASLNELRNLVNRERSVTEKRFGGDSKSTTKRIKVDAEGNFIQ